MGARASNEAVLIGGKAQETIAHSPMPSAARRASSPCDGDIGEGLASRAGRVEDGPTFAGLLASWQTVAIEKHGGRPRTPTAEPRPPGPGARQASSRSAAPRSWVADAVPARRAAARLNIGDVRRRAAMVRDAPGGSDPGPFADVGIRVVATRLATLTGRNATKPRSTGRGSRNCARTQFPHCSDETRARRDAPRVHGQARHGLAGAAAVTAGAPTT